MKVILQQEVKNLGKQGDIIEVSEGYARNFLLPRKLVIPATSANVNVAKQQKAAEAYHAARLRDEAKVLGVQLAKTVVTIAVKTGEGGRMFGSVTGKDIADALLAQHGVELDKRKIELKEAVKNLGTYPVSVKLHPEVSTEITVHVIAQ